MLLPGSARSLFLEACLSENITCDASVSATWCEKQILRGYKKGGAVDSYFGCKKGGGVCVLAPRQKRRWMPMERRLRRMPRLRGLCSCV